MRTTVALMFSSIKVCSHAIEVEIKYHDVSYFKQSAKMSPDKMADPLRASIGPLFLKLKPTAHDTIFPTGFVNRFDTCCLAGCSACSNHNNATSFGFTRTDLS